VIFSSVLHEVHSYNGYSRAAVRAALASAARLLAPGGRLLLRDGVRPQSERAVLLECDGADASALGSTRERFRRFAREFKGGPPDGGVTYLEPPDGGFVLALPDANEFLTKKDYLEHWDLEVREEFGVFSLDGWRAEVANVGLEVVHAAAYLSPWIEEHRYRGRCALRRWEGDRAGAPEPFPATNFVLAAQKEG
jgi:SAM-dependent methyltransferase